MDNAFAPTSWDAVALDVQSRKIILYQGYNASFDAVEVETWAYDLETGVWENRHPAVQPPTRWGSTMVYDPKADRVLLYGGANFAEGVACGFCGATTVLGDLWAYDYESNTWTELHPSVSPPPHHFPVLEYVPTIDRVILFGGFQQGFTSLFNDTWAYDFNRNRWKNLKPTNPPAPRAYHYMALESTTNRIVLHGGTLNPSETGDEVPIDETWIYSVAKNSWKQVFPEDPPGPRAWHVMSRTNGSELLFGGGDSRSTWTNDTSSTRRAPTSGSRCPETTAMTTGGVLPPSGSRALDGTPRRARRPVVTKLHISESSNAPTVSNPRRGVAYRQYVRACKETRLYAAI